MYEKFEQFKLWFERKMDYSKINENLLFWFLMQETGLENYKAQAPIGIKWDHSGILRTSRATSRSTTSIFIGTRVDVIVHKIGDFELHSYWWYTWRGAFIRPDAKQCAHKIPTLQRPLLKPRWSGLQHRLHENRIVKEIGGASISFNQI